MRKHHLLICFALALSVPFNAALHAAGTTGGNPPPAAAENSTAAKERGTKSGEQSSVKKKTKSKKQAAKEKPRGEPLKSSEGREQKARGGRGLRASEARE